MLKNVIKKNIIKILIFSITTSITISFLELFSDFTTKVFFYINYIILHLL